MEIITERNFIFIISKIFLFYIRFYFYVIGTLLPILMRFNDNIQTSIILFIVTFSFMFYHFNAQYIINVYDMTCLCLLCMLNIK